MSIIWVSLFVTAGLFAQVSTPVNDIIAELKNPKSTKVLVVAHRGDWRNFPENSVEGIKSAIEMGVDMVEIDVHKTKDGHLVLMHDETLNRTTTGKGNVADWTLDSLKTLYLKNGIGIKTRYKIPSLEEAMLATKGKVLVNLDKCYAYFPEAYEVLKRTNTVHQAVMKASKPYAIVQKEFGNYLKEVIFMPVIDLDKPSAKQIIEDYQTHYKPVAFELVFKKSESASDELLKNIVAKGSKIWINSLWESLNGGHDDDLAVTDIGNAYGWILDKKATLIQTDRPLLLLAYLNNQNRR